MFLLYLAGVSSSIVMVTGILGVVFLVGCVLTTICICVEAMDNKIPSTPILKKGVLWGIAPMILILVSILAPNKETIYLMAAAYGVQAVAENPDVKRLAGKSLTVLENTLDEYLKKAPTTK